jgi:twitching motility two-component system response regulator PilH
VAHQSSTVFVVEDDVDTRTALCELLEDQGLDVSVASNGAQALQWLRRAEMPCAMLIDLTMPGIAGEDLIEYLRAETRLASIPIAIVSASPERAPPGFRVFGKPIDIEALVAFVKERCPVNLREQMDAIGSE